MENISVSYIPNIFGRLSFPLRYNGYPVFHKTFQGNSLLTINLIDDTITIPSHFFKTGERLTYSFSADGSSIGINPSSPGSGGSSTLPSVVYPIYVDENTIRVALAASLALQNQYVDITSVGVGSVHTLTAEKQNSKCLISIDNIIQSPVSVSGQVNIVSSSSSSSQKITLDSLEDIKYGTILKIGQEYVRVISINYETKEVVLYRGIEPDTFLGSTKESLSGFSTAFIINGNYNIVKDKIYFTDAPLEGTSYNIKVIPSNINFSTTGPSSYSFNYFTNNYKTGSQVILYAGTPPNNLESGKTYFIIKNGENNFSFAKDYSDAINGVKIPFNNQNITVSNIFLNQFVSTDNSTFHGRAFLRSNYQGNLVFDDVSSQFNGINTTFTLTSSGINTVGIKSDNGIVLVNNIFQYPEFDESFVFDEDVSSGITSITFIGSIGEFQSGFGTTKDYDVNVGGRPRGGIIVGYGLSYGLNYQPMVQAEVVVEALASGGVLDNIYISINVPGSGYRSGIATYYVHATDSSGNTIPQVGKCVIDSGSVVSVDILSDHSFSSLPSLIVDSPIPYDNIPVSGSTSGIGASVSFLIDTNGTVSNFRFTNPGYGYTAGEILTPVGILTGPNYTSNDALQIKLTEVYKDSFSAWNVGRLRKLDDLSSFTNGRRKTFTLTETIDGQTEIISLETEPGSPIDLECNLLVFLNDVLQIPGSSYTFNGGTKIRFSEAPPKGSTLKIYFYEGSTGDTELVDIDPRIKIGDNLLVKKDLFNISPPRQEKRTVKDIISSDEVLTELYGNGGLSLNSDQLRSVDWTPQKRDLIISGGFISKSRSSLRGRINRYNTVFTGVGTFVGVNTNIIGISTTLIQIGDYVESSYVGSGVSVASIGSTTITIGRPGDLWKFDGSTWTNFGQQLTYSPIIGEIENVQSTGDPLGLLSSTFPSAVSGDGVRDNYTSIVSASPSGINTSTVTIYRKL